VGPPSYPATFVDHDLSPGGRAAYFMTSPEGRKYHGWWRIEEVDPPRQLRFEDGFGDDEGEGMEQVVEMGMEHGMVEALGQIDALLAGERA
jgi:uncharacterized protein YndB with AHSA1/START domain